ncbi:MAG: hypothetical protein AABX86_00780 [Nanoarchaeota archaeon]
MSKKDTLRELVNILVKSLRHKIGSIVNEDALYAAKYAKDAEILLKEAQKVHLREHWNRDDKIEIKERLANELRIELTSKEFIADQKFDYIEKEIKEALRILDLE